MKKIIAFSVLLVLLTAAVFAQDDNGSGWKIGFSAQLARNFLYATKATADFEVSMKYVILNQTMKGSLGEYTKGSSNLWTYTNGTYGAGQHDNRIALSIFNNGEHHDVYFDVAIDDSWIGGGPSFGDLFTNGNADWWFAGDTGASGAAVVLDARIGTGRYNGFVPVYEIWDDYIQRSDYNFFGVVKNNGFLQSNNISTTAMDGNPWQSIYAIGLTVKDNFRLAIGSTLGSFSSGSNDPFASTSNVEAGFMLSGKNIAELISFDVFYAIKGGDNNTIERGTGKWNNIIGAYVGLDLGKAVKGLGISVGYTANFKASENGQIQTNPKYGDITDPNYDPTHPVFQAKYEAYEITNPLWSGIDINFNFSGIDKIGITFANNLSFASVTGSSTTGYKDTETRIIGLDGTRLNPVYEPLSTYSNETTQNWFAYKASLGFGFSITERLKATLGLRNLLTVDTTEFTEKDIGWKSTETSSLTTDDLFASIHLDYNVGNVTFGIGLSLGVLGFTVENETSATGGYSYAFNANLNTATFSVPIFFKVAF